MVKSIESKTQFLLFSFLNSLHLIPGDVNSSPLRSKTYQHFKEYLPKKDISSFKEIHHSKFVVYCLTLGELPDLEELEVQERSNNPDEDVKIGSCIRPLLLDFYQHTDFDNFYSSAREEYLIDVKKVEDLLNQVQVNDLLDEVWGNSEGEMRVVPMPLANRREGFGPQINGISYQVIGGPYDFNSLLTILHEASHPRAKTILKKFLPEIDRNENLVFDVDFDNFPKIKAYKNNWRIYFEEHLIRAIQHIFINTKLGFDREEGLKYELDSGLVFIYKFAEVLDKYQRGKINFEIAIPTILENCL